MLFFIILSGRLLSQPVFQHVLCDLPSALVESSGLEQDAVGNFWSHNDSGNLPVLYYFDASGALLSTIRLTNATNTDWEDIALDENGILYVGDIGNNSNQRQNLRIYKVEIGILQPGENLRIAQEIKLSYQNQTAFPPDDAHRNFDAEALVYRNDSLYIFTKNRTIPFTGLSYQYAFPAHSGEYFLAPSDSFVILGNESDARITGADLSSMGELALLTTTQLLIYPASESNKLAVGVPEQISFTELSQKEGICWGAQPCSLYISDEYVPAIDCCRNLYELIRCDPNSVKSTINQQNALFVYPNPTQDYLIIKIGNVPNKSKIDQIRVYSVAGSEVEVSVTDLDEDKKVRLNNCKSGNYIVLVQLINGGFIQGTFQFLENRSEH